MCTVTIVGTELNCRLSKHVKRFPFRKQLHAYHYSLRLQLHLIFLLIQGAIHNRRQRPVLNTYRDMGYELPAIFNQLLSRH